MHSNSKCYDEDNNSVDIKNKNTNVDKNLDSTSCTNTSESDNNTTFVINNNISAGGAINGDTVSDFEGIVESFNPVSTQTAIAEVIFNNIQSGQKVLLFSTVCWVSNIFNISNPQFQIVRNNDFANPIYTVSDTGDDVYSDSPTTTTIQFLDETPPTGNVSYKLVINPTGETITACADAVFTAFLLK